MFARFNAVFILLLIASGLFATDGKIRGIVYDEESGESMPGVTIYAEGTTSGTITDLEGKYSLDLEPGTYSLRISFVSYEAVTITDIEVNEYEVMVLDDVGLKISALEMEEVVITATQVKNTETAMMAIKMKSANVLDGVSATKLRRIGDSDAAAAMKRVTGVSVSGGKYVFVRGLGDRYTKTTLNGVDIPGLDPDRNTLQMDIFPTNVIDNLIVNKSFSADLPADFTGGLVDIATKAFPEEKTGAFSAGLEFNPNFHFNGDFLSYEGGATDWFGFDDGTRKNPITNPSIINNNSIVGGIGSELGQEYRAALESFYPVMSAREKTNLMNLSLGLSMGNQFDREKVKVGYNVALSYKNETEFYESAFDGKYILNNDRDITELINADYQEGALGISNSLVALLGGLALKTNTSKYRLNLLHLQNGVKTAGIFFRSKNNEGSGFDSGLQHNLEFNQRSLTNVLIDGKHLFQDAGWTIEWKLSPTFSRMYDPDIRMTQYKIEDDGSFDIDGGENDKPARIWRNLDEINLTGLFHMTRDFQLFTGRKARVKFGGAYTYKERDFLIEAFKFNISGVDYTGEPDELFYEENLWPYQGTDESSGVLAEQNFIPNNTNEFNSYVHVQSAYVKTEINPLNKLKATLGVRFENYQQYYNGYSTGSFTTDESLSDEKVLNDQDFFPEVNLIYEIVPRMNARFSYSRTIARPSFKELSFAQIEDPISGTTFNGGLWPSGNLWDGELVSTSIQNFDIRWETYFNGGQMVSVSGFYKTFENPIEIILYPGQSSFNLQPRNVGNGTVLGAETEFRLNLGSLVDALRAWSISSNLTLITSKIDRDEGEYGNKQDNARTGETVEPTRLMAGMSPYIVNAGISYLGRTGFLEGAEAGLYYNVQGQSLEVIGVDDRPDVYSVPFHSLNFNSKVLLGQSKRFSLGLKVTNILNEKKELVYKSYGSPDLPYYRRVTGTTFSISMRYKF